MAKGKSKSSKNKAMAFRGGISDLMKQSHRMQTKLEKLKDEIKDETWTTEAAGGKIKITINGAKEITQIEIDKELINPDEAEMLQDVIISAVNAAIALADEKLNEATEKITQGIRIPGLF
jgi:DNA-binding YbaB/EbfC family protein